MTTSGEEDDYAAELTAVDSRLKVVISLLKEKHTIQSLNAEISSAEARLNDHSPFFVCVDNGVFEGTRHVDALLRKIKAMELKASMSPNLLGECARLLERKVQLLNIVR
jgi:hypothetical protein